MEIEVLSKNVNGTKKSTFNEVGEVSYSTIQFKKDSINFSKMWMNKSDDTKFIDETFNKYIK